MSLHQAVCCSKTLLTDFCPYCGKSKEEAEALGETFFPYDFSTHAGGNPIVDSSSKQLLVKILGLTDTVFLYRLDMCDRHVGLNWRLTENGLLELRSVTIDGSEYKRT